MTFSDEQKKLLGEPLNREFVKKRQGKFSYIEGWKAIEEANRIFGFDGWTRETLHMEETNRELLELQGDNGPYKQWRVGYIARVRVTVGGVVRDGTGFGIGAGRPEALGDVIESACKEAETDAMKRAIMTFGYPFGLALYDKEQVNVETPHPLANPKAAKPAIAKAIRAAGVTDPATIKSHVEAWVASLGLKAFDDTSGEQRQAYIHEIQAGKYSKTEAAAGA